MLIRRKYFLTGFHFLVILLFPLLNACNFVPAKETSDPNAIITYAAQTIAVNQQQGTIDAMQIQLTSQFMTMQAPTVTMPPTEEPLAPTEMPSATIPPPVDTLAPPTPFPPSPTPPAPILTANIETRCRQGPNPAFAVVSFILVGQKADVIGKNPENTWWLIHDPQGKFGNCWVWGETTQLLGDIQTVPVVEPPPLPTNQPMANFNASFANFHICGGVGVATFAIGNTGTLEFRSSNITIWDVTNNVGLAGPESSNNPFLTSAFACLPGFTTLPAGATAFVAKGMGFLPSSGTRGRGIIVLCTLPNLGGQCLEQRANFTFP